MYDWLCIIVENNSVEMNVEFLKYVNYKVVVKRHDFQTGVKF